MTAMFDRKKKREPYLQNSVLDFPFSIAPMVGITHRFFRRFVREITKKTVLYTPMVHSHAILSLQNLQIQAKDGKQAHSSTLSDAVHFSPIERPLIVQIAGSEPSILGKATRIIKEMGFDGINLNLGCPAASAKSGVFGACLMNDPGRASECVAAMIENAGVDLPISVKHRLGLDVMRIDPPALQKLRFFLEQLARVGCRHFIVHARTAILSRKIRPKDNRHIPPLQYAPILQLAKEYPDLRMELNGGIANLTDARKYLPRVSGVMIGRAAVKNPLLFLGVDSENDSSAHPLSHHDQAKPDQNQILLNYLNFLAQYTGVPHRISSSDLPQLQQNEHTQCRRIKNDAHSAQSTSTDCMHPMGPPMHPTAKDWEPLAKKMAGWKKVLKKRELRLQRALHPLHSLYAGQPGNRTFRKMLSQLN